MPVCAEFKSPEVQRFSPQIASRWTGRQTDTHTDATENITTSANALMRKVIISANVYPMHRFHVRVYNVLPRETIAIYLLLVRVMYLHLQWSLWPLGGTLPI